MPPHQITYCHIAPLGPNPERNPAWGYLFVVVYKHKFLLFLRCIHCIKFYCCEGFHWLASFRHVCVPIIMYCLWLFVVVSQTKIIGLFQSLHVMLHVCAWTMLRLNCIWLLSYAVWIWEKWLNFNNSAIKIITPNFGHQSFRIQKPSLWKQKWDSQNVEV